MIQKYPGFGGSDSFYSFSVGIYNVGAFIASILTGFLTHCLPYMSIFFSAAVMHTAAGALYGFATNSWMIALSRFLYGVSNRSFKVAALTYVGDNELNYINAYINHETTKNTDKLEVEEKEQKLQIKKTVLIILSMSTFLPALFGPGK